MKREYEHRIYRMEDKHLRISQELKAKRMKIQELKKEDLEGANTFDVLYYVSSTFHRFLAGKEVDGYNVSAHDMHLDVIRDWNDFVDDRMAESLQVAVSNFVTKKLRHLQVEHDGDLQRLQNEVKHLKQRLANAKPWDSTGLGKRSHSEH